MSDRAWALVFVALFAGLGLGALLGWDTACWEVRGWVERRREQREHFNNHVIDAMTLANFERDDQGLYARSYAASTIGLGDLRQWVDWVDTLTDGTVVRVADITAGRWPARADA